MSSVKALSLGQCMFFTAFLSAFSYVNAEELPLWEVGLGLGGLHQSYYTGTEQTKSYLFPVIIPVYRGDFLKSDDKGIRAQLFEDERYKLDFSLDYSFPVDSDDIDLREGMPDIGSLIEVGPSLEIRLAENQQSKWFLKFPVRFVTEFEDREFDYAGYNVSPTLSLEKRFTDSSWKLGASLSFKYGDEKYNSIYYRVASQYATDDRSAYAADSGYAGTRLQLALTSKTSHDLWVLFMRYDNINGAVFDDSPLVETDDNLTVGFIYSRYIFKSKTMVSR